jgi:hypothetical protein
VNPFTLIPEEPPIKDMPLHMKNSLISVDLDSDLPKAHYERTKKDEKLPYNHFLSMKEVRDFESRDSLVQFEVEIGNGMRRDALPGVTIKDAMQVQGYDGFSGVHDNLYWEAYRGHLVYTLHNKLIFEDTKDRT